MTNWNKIWSKRKIKDFDDTLLSLINLDGFDEGAGNISKENWINYVSWIKEKLNIIEKDSIFEVGCGGGAFKYPFYKMGHKVSGVDFSNILIKNIQKTIPVMKFHCQEAIKLNVNEKYDYIISNSVFQYFESYNYAENVIIRMLGKAKKKIAILDINDMNKKNEAETLRKGALSDSEYETKYSKLIHLFYEETFFIEIAKRLGYTIEVFSQNINEYGNNPFRFNVIITKD